MIRKTLTALALGMTLTATWAQNINFGIISTESTQNLKADWQPLIDDMAKQTGLKVTAFFAPDYAGIIEGMRFNKVQVAWLGNKSAMEAVDRANGEVFAQLQYFDGSFGYHALLITHKDSPYQNVDDVFKAGKAVDFGMGDPNSTSGFLVPSYYLFAARGVEPRNTFKTVRNASHGANIQAVLAKQLDVATNNTEDMGKLESAKPELFQQLRIIWRSPLIPSDPFVWRKDLDAATKTKLRDFVLAYAKTDPAEKAVLKNIYNYGGFRASNNDQLMPIRQLELFRDRRKVENDEAMAADEKAKKLADIDRRLAALKS